MKVVWKDKITGQVISGPNDSTTAKAAGNPPAEIPPPEAPELPSLHSTEKVVEEDSQTEETEDLDNGQRSFV